MNDFIWLPIEYREFHDVPRLIRLAYGKYLYFLDCPFDDAADDYPLVFAVYRHDAIAVAADSDWGKYLAPSARLGEVRVEDVKFDETRRKFVSSEFLSRLSS